MGLLDGLEKLGIKNVETNSMYETAPAKKASKEEPKVKEKAEVSETDFLLKKTYECPVCGTKYKDIGVKSNRARLINTDKDLRPIYENIEPLKYEALVCPVCGYAVMSRYMTPLTPSQKKAVKDNISLSFSGNIKEKDTYGYDEAIERITLALASAIVKRAKASEKAYICLKGGWLCRSYIDTLDPEDAKKAILIEEISEKEKEFLDNAYEGFINAMQQETFPIAGMDETTLDYLVAVMAMERGSYDVSSRMIASILKSPSASSRIKDKARELKTELVAKLKESKG